MPAQNGKLDLHALPRPAVGFGGTIHLQHDHHGSPDDEGHIDHHHDDFDSVVVEARVESREQIVAALATLVEATRSIA